MDETDDDRGPPRIHETLIDEKAFVSLAKSTDPAIAPAPIEERYRDLAALGEGGMGDVRLVRDVVIGRDVALKRVRRSLLHSATSRDRFFREGRVQGQLEHPSIVPVYDLGISADERPFFTMRRIRGRTLDQCTTGEGALSLHALLAAMSRVCLAVDFAHAHGVVHRDLKPSNLMIGDYGEVYVLDWGLAKLVDDTSPEDQGAMLGTPGFMSPEQIKAEGTDARSDVFALGVCLFELLAGAPLVPGRSAAAILSATVRGADARFSTRVPERALPIEIEAICVRATDPDPNARFASARAMSEAIEAFLEGGRDLERRRKLGEDHARAAAALVEASRDDEIRARSDAMREVGRALAYDPENAEARRVMVRLLTDPPRAVPAEVEARMLVEREGRIAKARRSAAAGFAIALLPNLLLPIMGIRAPFVLGVGILSGVIASGLALLPLSARFAIVNRYAILAVAGVGMVAASRIASPFVFVPSAALAVTAGLVFFPRKAHVAVCLVTGLAFVLAPVLLEATGLLPRSMAFSDAGITILPEVAWFPAAPTLLFLSISSTLPLVAACLYLARIRERLDAAERALHLQAWQLRQIVPPGP